MWLFVRRLTDFNCTLYEEVFDKIAKSCLWSTALTIPSYIASAAANTWN